MTPRNVGTLARLSLALALAGGGLALVSQRFGPRLLVAAILALGGVGLAAFCIRHGARNEHEHGRYLAWLAVLLGLVLLLVPVWAAALHSYREPCPTTPCDVGL